MLGYFMNCLSGKGMTQIQTTSNALYTPTEGLPIVAVKDVATLKETGLPSEMRFGIAAPNDKVICQVCIKENMSSPKFCVEVMDRELFCPRMWSLCIPEHAESFFDLPGAYKRARKAVGDVYSVLRSYPGDDFVAECLMGLPATTIMRMIPYAGQHWWTPLQYNIEEITDLTERALNIKLPKVLPKEVDMTVLKSCTHHGIAIEDKWVIHFASCRIDSNQIKLDTLDTFCNITPYAEKGGPCHYKNDTEFTRTIHRNRAVWILFHAKEWGKYNFITNNCEHMSRMCKVGRRESAQVKKGVGGAISFLAGCFVPEGKIIKTVASIGIPYILNTLLSHRSSPDAAPLPFT